MIDIVRTVDSPQEITDAATRLRDVARTSEITPHAIIQALSNWADALNGHDLESIPGIAFLRLWLRPSTLEPIVTRELGRGALAGEWTEEGRARLKAFALGVVGHWPAGNIEIQPVLSMTCALLGGNASLVRLPSGLVAETKSLMLRLVQSDTAQVLTQRILMAIFDHHRTDLHEAMARSVDGAMIWGGAEAVTDLRALPFPSWARMAVFGPRISAAIMDADAWIDSEHRALWCQRIARDVWPFDQQACSSPQVLFLEKRAGHSPGEFVPALRQAFETENRMHPRCAIHPALTSAICQARASWLLDDATRSAVFSKGPDWTILLGSGSDIPQPTQGRTLAVLEVDDLFDPISRFDGKVQTLGIGMSDVRREQELASMAGRCGVDRIVKLGRMHVFVPPWDGVDLIRPMVRIVRHVPSTN